MDIEPNSQRDSHASDIIGVQSYEAERPKKREFLPWHKPRKHFVRETQWLNQINELIDEVIPSDNVLKYLGLPGDDLLDLRYFHQKICEPRKLKLRFLGFNYGANSNSDRGTDLFISQDEVNKLSFVDPISDIIGDDICQIANPKSIAWKKSSSMGPYDIVNIDLCDGFAKQPHDKFLNTHYNSLSQIMGLQSRRHSPWLLFLTTRTGSKHTDAEVLNILKGVYDKNLIECEPFLNASKEDFNIINKSDLDAVTNTSKGVSDVFLISLCKWIAKLGVTQQPPAKVKVQNVFGYTIDKTVGHQDLISIALKIEPTLSAVTDHIGLAQTPVIQLNECDMAVQVLKKIAKQKDVDQILISNADTLEKMINETSSLLSSARYDITGYATWANAH